MPGTERTLVVLRHAKAEPADGAADELRPLALQGRKQANRLGKHLAEGGLLPEVVLCSTALRTRQTWELAKAALKQAEPQVEMRDELYGASPSGLLAAVRGIDARVRTVLLVGHEPAVSGLAGALAALGSDQGALAQVRAGVPTAAFSVLTADVPWEQWGNDVAQLTGVFRPEV